MQKTILTGIKPTGDIHLGNYIGAIRPAIEMSKTTPAMTTFYFIADYHALTFMRDPKEFKEQVYAIAASWLALGLDPNHSLIYKQSDLPQIFELAWILNCFTPKGDMNRAHSYKDKVAKNLEEKRDQDFGVNMGLFSYPVLMAADILMFDSDLVPVGKDQVQHVEIARSIAQRINETFKKPILKEPQELLQDKGAYVPGLDGRKMSKSYGNGIALWLSEKKLRKTIMKITTDSTPPEAAKNPDDSLVMDFYKLVATPSQVDRLSERYRAGIGWGEAKQELFERVNEMLKGPREEYEKLMKDKGEIDRILARGGEVAREKAEATMQRVRSAITGF